MAKETEIELEEKYKEVKQERMVAFMHLLRSEKLRLNKFHDLLREYEKLTPMEQLKLLAIEDSEIEQLREELLGAKNAEEKEEDGPKFLKRTEETKTF